MDVPTSVSTSSNNIVPSNGFIPKFVNGQIEWFMYAPTIVHQATDRENQLNLQVQQMQQKIVNMEALIKANEDKFLKESNHLNSQLKYYEGLSKDFESDLEAYEYNNQKLQEKIKNLLSSHHDLEIINNNLKADKVRDDSTIKALRRLTKNVRNMYEESQLKIKSQQEEIIQLAKANQQLCEAIETSAHDETDSWENTCTEFSKAIQPTKSVSESPTNSHVFPPTPDNVIPPVFTPFSVHAVPSTVKSHLLWDQEAPVSTGQLCESENHLVSFSPLKFEATKPNEQRIEERDKPSTVDLITASAVQTTEAEENTVPENLIEAIYSHDNDSLPMSPDLEATHHFYLHQKMKSTFSFPRGGGRLPRSPLSITTCMKIFHKIHRLFQKLLMKKEKWKFDESPEYFLHYPIVQANPSCLTQVPRGSKLSKHHVDAIIFHYLFKQPMKAFIKNYRELSSRCFPPFSCCRSVRKLEQEFPELSFSTQKVPAEPLRESLAHIQAAQLQPKNESKWQFKFQSVCLGSSCAILEF